MPARKILFTNDNSPVQRINRFLSAPISILPIMFLTVLSNTLGLELVAYTVFVFLFAYTCVFCDDLLPLVPTAICCYIAPSVHNNPGINENSVFYSHKSGIYLMCLAIFAAMALIYRLIRDRRRFFSKKYKLLPGMLALTLAYLLGGIASQGYSTHAAKSILFALLNAAAIIIPYVIFSGGVDWNRFRRDYFAWSGFGIGCVLLCQILWIYLTAGVITDGVIQRSQIFTGWGMYNNMGALLAMMIPFPFYLATRYRRGWLGTVIGSVFVIGIVMTCSRGSILCGCAIYFLCVILMLYYANDRKANTLALIIFGGSLSILLVLFSEPLLNLFSSLLVQGLDPSNRDIIYRDGMLLFSRYPVFGGSFFSTEYAPWGWSTVETFTNILPPRWHNTLVQLLASCGIVGLGAYLFHRIQTVLIFVKDRKPEKMFIAASILVLLACSMFDCHFFNIGPVLFYSMALAFAENN